MNIDRRGWWIVGVLVAFCVAIALVFNAGQDAGKRSAEADHYRVLRDTVVDSIRVVEQRIKYDTIRVRVAEQHTAAAIVAFDSAAARVEAVADTSSVVPTSLVLPEIQTCRDMRDSLLVQLDIRKVYERDDADEIALQKRRADLAEAQLAKQKPPRIGFKSGVVAGVTVALAVTHPETVLRIVRAAIHLLP